jgi:Tfp pilus assembly ATPase PilU
MQTFNQALATLYFQKKITLETALSRSSKPEELQEMIQRGAGVITHGEEQPEAVGQKRP